MINPYATAFMIAARTDRVTPQRLRPAKYPEPKRRGIWPFRRAAKG